MGLVSLILYGVGDMLGAGIYGLVGKAAGLMGNLLWLGFLGSMLAAVFTGLSYASIGSRYPKAAGAAYVAQKAYQTPLLTWMIGLAITASGLTSMATGSRVVAGYLQKLGIEAEIPMLAL
jgi:amino acid transporter